MLKSFEPDITIEHNEDLPVLQKTDEILEYTLRHLRDFNAGLLEMELHVVPSQKVCDAFRLVDFTITVNQREQNLEIYGIGILGIGRLRGKDRIRLDAIRDLRNKTTSISDCRDYILLAKTRRNVPHIS
jgi:hypothetical protein